MKLIIEVNCIDNLDSQDIDNVYEGIKNMVLLVNRAANKTMISFVNATARTEKRL